MSYYAVAKGRNNGIYETWAECKKQIDGFTRAKYKKFKTKEEAVEYMNKYSSETRDLEPDNKDSESDYKDFNPNYKDFEPDYYVYTDGSCTNNGKDNAKAGYGIYFGDNDERNVSEKVIGKQSNNTGELLAIIKTFNIIKKDLKKGKKIAIVSDSIYAIRCATTYGKKLEKSKWKQNIPNKELVKEIYDIYNGVDNIRFIHIMAHTGKKDIHSIGNENADRLENMAIGRIV